MEDDTVRLGKVRYCYLEKNGVTDCSLKSPNNFDSDQISKLELK